MEEKGVTYWTVENAVEDVCEGFALKLIGTLDEKSGSGLACSI